MEAGEEDTMKILTWLGIAAAALILMSCGANVYNSETPGTYRGYDARDFNGEWQLVQNRSDYEDNYLNERDRFDSDWGSTYGTSDRSRYGAWFLPDVFRIEGSTQVVRIEDTGGEVIAEIPFNDEGYRTGSYEDDHYTRARWINDNRFEVERTGRNGRHMSQVFTLENRDRRLVVVTRVERDNTTRSFTRVYERA